MNAMKTTTKGGDDSQDGSDMRPLLEALARDPARHARFLNTLSLLEYIGVRKILKSQPAESLSAEMLEHILEEARHAAILKRLALRVGGSAVADYGASALLCGEEARRYIQTLDRGAAIDLLESGFPADTAPAVNYLYTTLLIEERAGRVYPVYEPVLAAQGIGGVLAGIVREEEGHLGAVTRRLLLEDREHAARLERLRQLERRAFAALRGALQREVDQAGGCLARTPSGT
jgi:hypothetical protein